LIGIVVDSIAARAIGLWGGVAGALLANASQNEIGTLAAAEISAIDEAIAVVVDSVDAFGDGGFPSFGAVSHHGRIEGTRTAVVSAVYEAIVVIVRAIFALFERALLVGVAIGDNRGIRGGRATTIGAIDISIAIVVDAILAVRGSILGCIRAMSDNCRIGGAGAIKVAAIRIAIFVVIERIAAGGERVLWRGRTSRVTRAIAVRAINATIAIIVCGIGAVCFMARAHRNEFAKLTAVVGAIDQTIVVIVAAIAATIVVKLTQAASFGNGLALAVAAVELAIEVVVDLIVAEFKRRFRLCYQVQRDHFAAYGGDKTLAVIAIGEAITVIVDAVAACFVGALISEQRPCRCFELTSRWHCEQENQTAAWKCHSSAPRTSAKQGARRAP
jgi:hypothetical protein